MGKLRVESLVKLRVTASCVWMWMWILGVGYGGVGYRGGVGWSGVEWSRAYVRVRWAVRVCMGWVREGEGLGLLVV